MEDKAKEVSNRKWRSGYKNYEDYLETMKAYRFYPLKREEWERFYQSKDERIKLGID